MGQKWRVSVGNKLKKSFREGTEVYRHPAGHFIVLEFQGKIGHFRESFYPEELVSAGIANGR